MLRLPSKKTEINTYDRLNQLIGFTDGETTASYTYDVNGLRLSKTVNGVKTTHIWIGNQIAVDYTGSYTSTVYLRETSLVAAFNWDEGYKGDYRFYTQNAHGDVVSLTNSTGAVVKSYTYDAFGVEKNIDDSDSNPFRYCGEYFDTETGTIYLRARYYNPTTGRFISRDSVTGKIEDPLSLNLYTYCHNNPIFFQDPSGHFAIVDDLIILGVVATALLIESAVVLSMPETQQAIDTGIREFENSITNYSNSVPSESYWDKFGNINDIYDQFNRSDIITEDAISVPKTGGISITKSQTKEKATDKSLTIAKTKTVPQKRNYSVYKLTDTNGIVQYVGRTNCVPKTRNRHRSNPYRKDLTLEVIHQGLTYPECRWLEHYYIGFYKTLNKSNPMNNQIAGVSTRNKNYEKYMKAGNEYLKNVK